MKMLQCALKTLLNSLFSFYVPNCRRKIMFMSNTYKIIIQTSSECSSEIHFPRLSYLMQVSQRNGCPNHMGLCSLLFASPKSWPAISAPFLLYILLHILQHLVQKSLSPGTLQFLHTAFSPFPSVPQLSSPTSTVSFYILVYIYFPH